MRRVIVALLLSASVTYGQQRSLPPQKTMTQSLPGTVTLTLAEYNRLLEIASRHPKPAEAAPVPFALSRAAFKLRVENESVVGTLDIDGEVLQKGPTKVPLSSGLTILEAQQSQTALPLFQEGATHNAVVSGPGRFSVSLKVASALTIEAGRASFNLPVPAAASSLLSLDISGSHANVHVEPGLITSRTTSIGHTIVEATIEPGRGTRVWWTTREVAAPVAQREVRFLSDVKTLLSVGDSELRVTSLCDITVIQGEPAEFRVPLPTGYEVTEVTGSTLESSEAASGVLILKVREPARRTHQFLIAVERPGVANKLDAPFVAFDGVQRETGEVLVEGVGAMALTAVEGGGLRRIDVREAGAVSRSLSRFPLQAAFRYHRRPGDIPTLSLEWSQFPDSSVLSAIAERAIITTLLNVEGKSLTEVTLKVRNHAQPFVKIDLPQGATLLSAEVEGEKVKPVQGADGSRVPLLRAGFRPAGPYTVSFVYLSTGAQFAKRGSYELSLPRLDVPVSLMSWEVSLPDRLVVRQLGGNALAADLFPAGMREIMAIAGEESNEETSDFLTRGNFDISRLETGQVGGIVVDPNGAIIAGAKVTVVNTQTGATQGIATDDQGRWLASGVASGPVRIRVEVTGFKNTEHDLNFEASRPVRLGSKLEIGSVNEAVTVTAGQGDLEREGRRLDQQLRKSQEAQMNMPSVNVSNLQRKVAGILPVQIEVPRAGRSYRFIRPLVLEEETKITFQYRSR
jgi:hypothetical protein